MTFVTSANTSPSPLLKAVMTRTSPRYSKDLLISSYCSIIKKHKPLTRVCQPLSLLITI